LNLKEAQTPLALIHLYLVLQGAFTSSLRDKTERKRARFEEPILSATDKVGPLADRFSALVAMTKGF
jgi:hypothetical protein